MAGIDDYAGDNPYAIRPVTPWPNQPAAPPRGMVAPNPTGPTGPLGYLAAPVAGAYEAAGNLGGAVQAGAKLIGASDVADAAAAFAARQRATAATYENPVAEKYPWYDPRGIAYQVLKGVPVMAGGLATAAGAVAAAPEEAAVGAGALAAGAFGYPFAIGSNVETSEASHGPLTKGQAAKAALLGVPEAAIGAYPFARISGMVAQGVKGSILHEATSQAAAQAIAGGAQDAIAQQMGDPNRPIASRMSEMMQSILTGGVTGALMGAGVHALAKVDPTKATNADLEASTRTVDPNAPQPESQRLLPPPSPVDQLGKPLQITDQSSNRLASGQVVPYFEQRPLGEEPVHAAPDVVNAPSPADIPVRPFQHLTDQEVRAKAEFLWRNGARPGDEELDALAKERQIRIMVADQSAQRALPAPERVATASPDLESARVHEPTTATVQTGFDEKGNPVLASAPIELGQSHVGSQEPIVPPAPPAPAAPAKNPMDEVRAAAKGRLPKPVEDLLADLKSTPEALETLLRDRFKSSGPGEPVAAGKPLLALAQHLGVLDGDGRLNAPKTPETPNAAVAPLEALRAEPEVRASPTLAAKVDAALETAKTPTPSPAATDIVAKLVAAKPKIVAAPSPETITFDGKQYSGATKIDAVSAAQRATGVSMDRIWDAATPEAGAAAKSPVEASFDALKARTDVAAPGLPPGAAKRVNAGWQAELAKDPTGRSAWDKYEDKLNPDAQAALLAHSNVVEDAKAKVLPGERPPGVEGQLTQAGVDISHIARNGGSLKDVLEYLQTNGETGLQKTVANFLRRSGIDASLAMDDNNDLHPTAAAAYDPDSNTVILRPWHMNGQLVLHEAVHAATARAIEADGPASKDMQHLYDTMKAAAPDRTDYGLDSVHEFTAEAFTNPDFQDFLASHPADPSLPGQPKTLWQAFKNVVAKIIGARPGGERTMLDQVLETGNRLMEENKTAPETTMSPVYSAVDRVKKFVGMGDQIRTGVSEQLNNTQLGIKPTIYNSFKGMRDTGDIVKGIAKLVPSAARNFEASKTQEARENTWNKVGDAGYRPYAALPDAQKQSFNKVAATTVLGIDGRKPWEAQDPELSKLPNRADLRARWGDAAREWGRLGADGQATYNTMVDTRNVHALAGLVQAMDTHVKTEHPTVTQGFENDPAHDTQYYAAGHDDPAAMKTMLLDELTKREAGIDAALKAGAHANKGVVPDKLASLQRFSSAAKTMREQLDGVPNFRLSHGEGNYYAAGAIPRDASGLPDQGAITKIDAALKAEGFDNLVLEHNNDNNNIYARVVTRDQADRLGALFQKLRAEGVLSDERPVSFGPSEQAGRYGVGPAVLHDMIAAMQKGRPGTDGMSPEDAERYNAKWDEGVRDVSRLFMDLIPGSSPAKIYAKRENVQGFEKDMGESFRSGVSGVSRMLAAQGMAGEKGAATQGMRAEVRALKQGSASLPDREMAQSAVNELMLREMQRPISQPSGFAKMLMALGQRMEIGTNPMYFLTLLTQNLTLSLPRLGSTVGYLQAAKSMGKATLPSFDVMRAMLKGPDGASAGMRAEVLAPLVKAGKITQGQADHLIQLDNQGAFHQSMTHAMTEHTDGAGWFAKAENWSRAMGLYAELQPRLQMALAARDAHAATGRTDDAHDFAYKMVDGSQLDWSRASTPRYVTSMGPFGAASPLMNQFMGYRIRLSTMLYREMHDMIGGDTPAQRKAAGWFLAGHLGATTVLAGALGLPMTAVLASVYDKLADTLTGDHNHDIIASFRNHLADVFGKPVAEAIARGAPRLVGLDLSHLGDQKIVPGSDMITLLTEKRKFEDAEKDWLKNMAGSAVGMLAKDVVGLRDISNGDYLRGAMKLAPEAMRGPIEALQQSLYGYRTKSGQRLPISSNAATIALTAMGLDPAGEAEYNEAKTVQLGLQNRQSEQTQTITQHLTQAMSRGDKSDFQRWLGESQQFQAAHPGVPPPIAGLARYMASNTRAAAIANGMGMPIGVRPNDIAARGMLRFGNLQDR